VCQPLEKQFGWASCLTELIILLRSRHSGTLTELKTNFYGSLREADKPLQNGS